MHEGDGADPPHGLLDGGLGLIGGESTPLESEQCRDRLQVVLDPMMDLPDRRVLGQQHPITTTQFGDVTEEDERTGDGGPLEQRREPHQHRDGGADLEFLGGRSPGRPHRGDGRLGEAEVAESSSFGIGMHPDAIERGDRIG